MFDKFGKDWQKIGIFKHNFELYERCKGVHCVDLDEGFPAHIFLQNLASIQLRTSPVKFARSPRIITIITDPPGSLRSLDEIVYCIARSVRSLRPRSLAFSHAGSPSRSADADGGSGGRAALHPVAESGQPGRAAAG